MVVKILILQGEKDIKIAKKIKRLRESWIKKIRVHQKGKVEKAKFDYYKEGLIDSLGLKKASELINLSDKFN